MIAFSPRPRRAKNVPITDARSRPRRARAGRGTGAPRSARLRAEQHHGDGGDRVGLEQVGRHAGAVADVVADVVGDHGRVARVVLRDAGLDLADEIGADVGGLREDAAAEPCEHGDERAAEGEPDEVVDRRLGRVVEPPVRKPVVPGDAEEGEPDDEQAGDRARPEGDVQRRPSPSLAASAVRTFERTDDVHADEARRRGERRADQEPERRPPAELVVDAEQDERDDRDDRDRHVLTPQVRTRALLYRARRSPACARSPRAGGAASSSATDRTQP